ncbi:MAG TPA: hypothetical protein ENG42_02415 [Candidatus Aenigmarchaeota archaeon]|nr:hypothetical protein [Candidatus Aenigmarchaeota archaeon]
MIKVGTSTGIYYAARDEQLASSVRKIGYALTRGTSVIELAVDVPHEVTYTEGKEIRRIAKQQGLDITFHGSLTVPLEMPEQTSWRDAQDHFRKGIKAAVFSGAKYINFHASLNFWLELLTYAGHKLTITLCDHIGRFISEILYEDKRLRKWFVEVMDDLSEIPYSRYILTEEELREAQTKAELAVRNKYRGVMYERLVSLFKELEFDEMQIQILLERIMMYDVVPNTIPKTANINGRVVAVGEEKIPEEKQRRIRELLDNIRLEQSKEMGERVEEEIRKAAEEKLGRKKPEERKWRVDTHARLLDGYRIVGQYLFLNKDPIWKAMVDVYKEKVIDEYKLDYNDPKWLDKSWEKADRTNDREFKSFFYAVVCSKFLEGHVKTLLEWMEKDLPKELESFEDKEELKKIAKELKIVFEIPDARDPSYGGMYMLWHPKQLYAAIKTIRNVLKTDKVLMLMDFEHLATQGVDPLIEMEHVTNKLRDFGKYVLAVHSNHPDPLHSHKPLELGDEVVYTILWFLRKTGFGKGYTAYLIYERGGGEDPFKQSIDALKLIAEFLEKDTPPQELPPEFYGLHLTAGDEKRQWQIILDHRFELLKDLLEMPEEEWGFLSSAATKKGKTKEWKKEELR